VVLAGQYFQDFSGISVGATNMGDGSQLFSTAPSNTAGVVDATYKELQLTALGSNSTHSAFLLPLLDTGVAVYALSAKFNAVVYGNFNTAAADGFSFSFGQLAGLNLASNAYLQESGFGTGVVFSARTYNGSAPGFFVNVNGAQVAGITNNPQTFWGNLNSTRHYVEIDWHVHLGLTVRMDGQTIVSNVLTTGFTPAAGDRIAIAARTGGFNEEFRIDNLVVVTRGLLFRMPLTAPYNSSGTNLPYVPSLAFDDILTNGISIPSSTGWVSAAATRPAGARVYALTSSSLSGDPKNFRLEGFTAGNWSICATDYALFLNDFETRAFLSTNTAQFEAFRLNVQSNSISAISLAELRIWEFLSITNDAPFQDWYIYGLADFCFSDAAWADYDNDGDLDFVVMGRVSGGSVRETQLWKNQGNGAFIQDTSTALPALENGTFSWGDYNNDGWVDFFIAGQAFGEATAIYKNDGDGTFTQIATSIPGGFGFGDSRWLDYDNDGDLDLLFAGYNNSAIWRNDGGDSFTEETAAAVNSGFYSTLDVADYNLDGLPDYARGGNGQLKVRVNQGNGTFTETIHLFNNFADAALAWGDSDADGDPDLFYAGRADNSFNLTDLRVNNGGDLSTYGTLNNHPNVRGGSAAWGDYDHDGDLDILFGGKDGGATNRASLLVNAGGNTFNALTNYQWGGFTEGAFRWGDFDNDGRLDYLQSGLSNFSPFAVGVTEVRRNFYSTPNQPPSAPTGLSSTTNGFFVTLNWNAASDDATPSNGLTYALRIGTTPGGCEIISPHANPANGFRRIPEFGNCWGLLSKTIELPSIGTFYWSVQAIDNSLAGGAFAPESTLVITPLPPAIAAREPVEVSAAQATIRCSVSTKGATGTVWFLWGTNANYGSTVAGPTLRTSTNFVLAGTTVTGLVPGTTYFYKPVVSNAAATVTNDGMAFVARAAGTRFDFADPGDPLFASSNNFPEAESPTQAIDNALSTKYLNFEGPGSGLDIRPSITGTLRAITVASANDSFDRDPTNFTLAGSSDGTNFVQFESGAVPAFTDRHEIQSVTLTNPASHAWYRLLFPGLNEGSEMQVAEVEFLPYGDLLTQADAPVLTLTPPGLNIVFSYERLFDRFVVDHEDKFEVTGFSTNEVLRVEIAPAIGSTILKGFELVGGTGYLSNPERRPGSVAISGSNDGTNYTVFATVVPDIAANEHPILEYSITNNLYAFTTYRVTFDAPTNGAQMELGEVRLFGRSATAIEQWRQQYFNTTDGSSNAGDTADPDGDGDANLYEYVTGRSPTSIDTDSVLSVANTNGIKWRFDRYLNSTDTTIYVETASNLLISSWSAIATNKNGSWGGATNVTEGGGNPAQVTVTDEPETSKFMRVRVTHP